MSEQPKSWIEIVEDGLVPVSLMIDFTAYIHARPAGTTVVDEEGDWQGPWSEFYAYSMDGNSTVVANVPNASYLWWCGDFSYENTDDAYANALFTIKLEEI